MVSTMRIEDLNTRGALIGMLEAPLGKVVTVEGDIVDGATLKRKAFTGIQLLRVSSAEGHELPEPRLLRFAWLAGAPSTQLTGRVRLVGYESGRFTGVPPDAFSHIRQAVAEAFHFESSFVVLKSL